MEIAYKLTEKDFLDFQMYTASKNERINKKKNKSWILIVAASLILGIYFYFQNNIFTSIYCLSFSIITGLFYRKYFIWKHKKHYQNFIKENYSKQFGKPIKLNFGNEYIHSSDKTEEGKFKLSEIEIINETHYHLFLKISPSMSIIIPKRELLDIQSLKKHIAFVGIKINTELDWTWK
ncbi:YcxB family protein [Brumimicrobium mesophilum]|uniref:YcxB family protein n=1 Tax=Brumimicrobium mesophilum TaxID=392717 RepID=UPI000D13FED0|nr:YcxB family protein [Brumimicrobium mesophilum]